MEINTMPRIGFLTIAVCCILVSNCCLAQPRQGQVGISASLQSLQLDFALPIWAADRLVVAPSIGFISASDQAKDIGLAAAFRYYIARQKLSPYVGVRVGR